MSAVPTTDADASRLLEPLNEVQQRFVEVVGEVYLNDPGTWPIFDYVEAKLDELGIDALDTFLSFPGIALPWGQYSAVWSAAGGHRTWPRPDNLIALTVLGMHHCKVLRKFPRQVVIPQIDLARAFIELLRIAAWTRREAPASPTKVRNPELRSGDVFNALGDRGYRFDQLPPRLLFDLMGQEPPFWGGGASIDAGGEVTWSRGIPRSLMDFEDVVDVEDYIAQLFIQRQPSPPRLPAAPSPLGLVAEIDYLDTVWQLAHRGKRLFRLAGAELVAKLAMPASTAEEFDSRVSGLGDILRSALDSVPQPKKKIRDKPLGGLEQHLVQLLGAAAASRIERNIATLERVLFVRDAGQHGAAGRRGAVALTELEIGYPITDRTQAWDTIKAETIEALDALREELRAFTSRPSAST